MSAVESEADLQQILSPFVIMFVEPEINEGVVADRAHRYPVAHCKSVGVVRTQTEVGSDVVNVELMVGPE